MEYSPARHSTGKYINNQVSPVKDTIPILAHPNAQTQAISHHRPLVIGVVLPILNLPQVHSLHASARATFPYVKSQ
jgi:hypothetical protein